MSQIGEPQRIHEIEPAVEPWVVTTPPPDEMPMEQPTAPEFEEEPAGMLRWTKEEMEEILRSSIL